MCEFINSILLPTMRRSCFCLSLFIGWYLLILAALCKKLWMNLCEILGRGQPWNKKQSLNVDDLELELDPGFFCDF